MTRAGPIGLPCRLRHETKPTPSVGEAVFAIVLGILASRRGRPTDEQVESPSAALQPLPETSDFAGERAGLVGNLLQGVRRPTSKNLAEPWTRSPRNMAPRGIGCEYLLNV